MKTTTPGIKLLAYGLCLAVVMYNCKTKDVSSVTPFTYKFKGLDEVKLPDVKTTAPAAVTVTPASVTVTAQAVAVTAGIASISATGQVPAAVQQAAADMNKVVAPDKAAALVSQITPAVLATLASTGKLPASLQTDITAIASNPAIKAYMPVVTLPTVNGKTVGGRVAAPVTVATVNTITDAGTDACKAAANAAFTTAKAALDAQLQTQTAPITAAYTAAVAAATAEVAGCQAPLPAKYSGDIAAATNTFNQIAAGLQAARSTLGDVQYISLLLEAFTSYATLVQSYTTLQTAESNACTLTRDAKISAAAAARDNDLNTINGNYNSALTNLTTSRDQAIASCHNQGGGRKGADVTE